jgi:hypothetical protein
VDRRVGARAAALARPLARPARLLAPALAFPLAGRAAPAQRRAEPARELHAEFLLGTAWNLRMPLVVRLPGAPPARLRARYATRPWDDAPYYEYRAGGGRARGCGDPPAGGDAGLLHHKLYLENPAPPVERFEVTHGYNLAGAALVRPAGRLGVRLGVAVVVAHAEGRVAGERVGGTRRTLLGGGYHVAGLAAQFGVARRIPQARGGALVPYALPEAKLVAALARVPVGDRGGSAFVPNVAAHALAGIGACRIER